MFRPIDLSVFPKERERALQSIYRYGMFEVVFYRSNLSMHTRRVLWLIEELLPLAEKLLTLDSEKARILALVHDDAEIITGDVQAGVKARMSVSELKAVAKAEEQAIQELAKKSPAVVHGYSYKKLLLHALKKDCVEAQLVSYVDKIDAHCESLHEVLAGNINLLPSVMFYVNALTLFPQKSSKNKFIIGILQRAKCHKRMFEPRSISQKVVKGNEKYKEVQKPRSNTGQGFAYVAK